MKNTIVIAAVGIILAACSDPGVNIPHTVIMSNPADGNVAQCRHDGRNLFDAYDIDSCVDGYVKAGWIDTSTQPLR